MKTMLSFHCHIVLCIKLECMEDIMINGNLEVFLDTGWFTESTLFYNGYTYWFEGFYTPETKRYTFFIYKWISKLKDDMYTYRYILNNDVLGFEEIYRIEGNDWESLKIQFLQAPLFDGKSFWQVEKELIQVDDGGNISINTKEDFFNQ